MVEMIVHPLLPTQSSACASRRSRKPRQNRAEPPSRNHAFTTNGYMGDGSPDRADAPHRLFPRVASSSDRHSTRLPWHEKLPTSYIDNHATNLPWILPCSAPTAKSGVVLRSMFLLMRPT